jgi:hypothetical protein
VITRAADHEWSAIMLTGATTILFVTTRVNPLFIMAGAGISVGWDWSSRPGEQASDSSYLSSMASRAIISPVQWAKG